MLHACQHDTTGVREAHYALQQSVEAQMLSSMCRLESSKVLDATEPIHKDVARERHVDTEKHDSRILQCTYASLTMQMVLNKGPMSVQ